MRPRMPSLIAALSLFAATSIATAAEYRLDAGHSKIGFSVGHLVISTVEGRFTDFSGTVTYDAQDIAKSSASVTIQATSITTDNDRRDNHLRGTDFFDVEKFPVLTFSGSKAVEKGMGLAMVGDFTMHGVTKKIELPFQIKGPITDHRGNRRIAIKAQMTLDRKEFGLTWNNTLETGGLVVGEEVTIDLILEAVSKK